MHRRLRRLRSIAQSKSILHASVKYKVLEEGSGRQQYIPRSKRCLACDGTGLNFDHLNTLSLLPSFYQCKECNGSGRRVK